MHKIAKGAGMLMGKESHCAERGCSPPTQSASSNGWPSGAIVIAVTNPAVRRGELSAKSPMPSKMPLKTIQLLANLCFAGRNVN